jgi:carbohydrate-binding DOMON domain-containing protein
LQERYTDFNKSNKQTKTTTTMNDNLIKTFLTAEVLHEKFGKKESIAESVLAFAIVLGIVGLLVLAAFALQ